MKTTFVTLTVTAVLAQALYAADYAVRPPVVGSVQTVNRGNFTDSFSFTASRGFPALFDVTGYHSHRYVSSGRAHYYITHDTAITNAVIVDAGGNLASQLLPIAGSYPTAWEAVANLPDGNYSLMVAGTVTGSGQSWYKVSLQYRFHELEKRLGWGPNQP